MEKTIRQACADLVRQWADRRLIASTKDGLRGARERTILSQRDRELLEDCADDIEMGRP